MNKTPSLALVVTTYNRPDALAVVLQSALAQTHPFDEILVADDGSGASTAAVIEEARKHTKVRIEHVWHPDEGFRAAAIRNRAIVRSRSDYVVFVDGDCVLRPSFAARHAALAERGWLVAGNRVLLSSQYTQALLQAGDASPLWRPVELLRQRFKGGLNRLLPLWPRPLHAAWRKRYPQRWEGAKTCNLAVWRDDLLAVDGFDEAFEGWGMEDSDLVIRLMHAGVQRKEGRFATGVFHLWHAENDRSRLTENVARLEALIDSKRRMAERGISGVQTGVSAGHASLKSA
ncbi:glycosyltransferase [Pigmentiphaga aceris]|uniref:Glycosyltransferase n=1 Tax=Pigmentiphaga aceris TaxID=1940612 RepID=A0A5C0AY88_9BURK|nr:glycosyltransferase family 2 protein [Pigmentiphaga aceris]QEI07452.1 glycosyltransferase [Pigmentiphaga aceris]